MKTRYKNGIISVDNPSLSDTKIYKEEYSRIRRKRTEKDKINKRYSENIKKRR